MTIRTMRSGDAGSTPLASIMEDIAGAIDDEVERREIEEFVTHYRDALEDVGTERALEVIRDVLTHIAQRNNPAISLTAFLIAAGFTSLKPESLARYGEDVEITRQAVSKEVVYFRDFYGMRPLGSSKSEKARNSYRGVQKNFYSCEPQKEDTHGLGFGDFYSIE